MRFRRAGVQGSLAISGLPFQELKRLQIQGILEGVYVFWGLGLWGLRVWGFLKGFPIKEL